MILEKQKVAIIGGGSWATAIAKLILNHTEKLNWYIRNKESINFIKKHYHNPHYLSSVHFDIKKLRLFNDLNQAIKSSDILIFAIPAAFLKDALKGISHSLLQHKIIVSAIKGIIPKDNYVVSDYFNTYFDIPIDNCAIIAGPCHAEEVALERMSYLTIASQDIEKAGLVAKLLECRYIKTATSGDIYGTEYSAVIKNIIAIASGVCRSLGYGDNFQAVLVSNALQEISRFLEAAHPMPRNIKNSAYLGDLLVTAYSQFSRNRTFGIMIGKGYSVKSAHLEMNMIAEGYYATKCIREMNNIYKVKMPICEAMFNILYEHITPSIEISLLADKLR